MVKRQSRDTGPGMQRRNDEREEGVVMEKGLMDQIGDWLRANKIPFPNGMRLIPELDLRPPAKAQPPLLKLSWENGLLGNKVEITVDGKAEESAFEIASVGLNGGSPVTYYVDSQPAMSWILDLVNEVYFPSEEAIGNRFPDHDTVSDLRAGLSLGLKRRGIPAPLIARTIVKPEILEKVRLKWKTWVKPVDAKDECEFLTWGLAYSGLVLQANISFREVASQFPNGLSEHDVAFARGYMGIVEEIVGDCVPLGARVWADRILKGGTHVG